ncbi:MAG: GNAT family N-acetyltransferase [Ktedonobacteraceae bacterium]|jgi:ribosomal protein S18 acetylase RimI-like enzyme
MITEPPTTPLVIRLATPDDIPLINLLDSYSDSPTRDIHREMEKYFGSVDPSTHEKILIFLAEIAGMGAAKAELMLPPAEAIKATGYIKRVVVDPQYRKRGLARQLLEHIITFAQTELHIEALDLHVWENNFSAIRLYEALGFKLQHRELYYRLPL